MGIAEFGDQTPEAAGATTGHSQSTSVVGTVGGGFDCFVIDNVALNFETKYRTFQSAMLEVNGGAHTINVNSVLLAGGLRIFFNLPRWVGSPRGVPMCRSSSPDLHLVRVELHLLDSEAAHLQRESDVRPRNSPSPER